jgi:hypothetical protein
MTNSVFRDFRFYYRFNYNTVQTHYYVIQQGKYRMCKNVMERNGTNTNCAAMLRLEPRNTLVGIVTEICAHCRPIQNCCSNTKL